MIIYINHVIAQIWNRMIVLYTMDPLTKACCCHLLMTCISLANDLETTMLTIHGYKIDSIQPLLSNVESDYVISLNNDSIKIRKTSLLADTGL